MLEDLRSQSILERVTTNILIIIILLMKDNTADEQEPSCMLFMDDFHGRPFRSFADASISLVSRALTERQLAARRAARLLRREL